MKRADAGVPRLAAVRGALIFGLLWAAGLPGAAQSDATNFITIREKAGVTTTQYPIQIGRTFVPGEIPNFPQAVLGTTNLATQADVKSRWPDGSVKHAALAFYLPTLTANSTVTINFNNQTAGNNSGFLAKADMLANGLNFDATMELQNGGTTLSASARAMLSADKFEYWHKGAVMTSVIIADHSAARTADIGFDANKSFRPIFHATFWPAINKVKVRYIGEIANTEALQDQMYALALKLGNTAPLTVYTKPSFKHIAASRWTKEFWLGGTPATIEINHNLAYLAKTKALPNYDTNRVIPETALAQAYTDPYTGWSVVAKDLYDPGNMMKYMGSTGGRDEIGPYPTWAVRWLYTGDQRMQEQTVGNANLSAAFPVHFREGNGAKTFESGGTNALGRVLSIQARPTIFLNSGNFYLNFQYTDPADKIVPVGAMTDEGWYPDGAHQPDFHSPLYLLTGDYFHLEEMYFWASWGAAYTSPGTDVSYGRGPTGATGGITGEVRSDAWIFRNRAQAAFLAPDGTPEKSYFTKLTNDAIAVWEGTVGITGTPNQGNANWNWGHTVAVQKYGPHGVPTIPALRFWEEGGTVPSWSEDVDPAVATNRTPPWQHAFLIYSLGQAKNLGFASDALLTWLSPMMIGQITNPGYDPYLLGAYQMPAIRKMDNRFFDVWSQEKTGFLSNYNAQQIFTDQLSDANHGYPMIAIPATGMVAHYPGGSAAWAFIQQQVLSAASLNSNPKWLILPPSTPPPCSFTLAATSAAVAATSGTGSLSFTASSSSCAWTATQNNEWLIITSGTAGLGNGTIAYSVAANTGAARSGTLTIAGQTLTVNQAATCNYTLAASSATVGAAAGTGSVGVTASDSVCSWTATSNAAWITITGGASGAGSRTVNYSVAANTGIPRTGTITIAGQTYTVNQASCATLSATSIAVSVSGGFNSVNVTGNNSSCNWTATSNASWLSIFIGASGAASRAVYFSVAANTGPARSGTLTIAGQTFTVNQASACTYSLSANSANVAATASNGSVNVTATNTSCPWTATSNANWITISAGASGAGSGSVTYAVSANTGAARSGTLMIAERTYTVNQAAGTVPCTYTLSATSANVAATANTGSVNVTASATSCQWTAASNAAWVSITGGTSGTGNGTVSYSVTINSGAARSGTLTIAGQTYTINQAAGAAPCTYSLSATSTNVVATANTGSVNVTASASNCTWSATSNSNWVTITAGASGTGNGAVSFSVSANSGAARSGTLTVAGQTFTINQAAAPPPCTYGLSASSANAVATPSSGSVNVTASAANCAWTAASNINWVTISSGANGTGNGAVNYSVAANNGAARSGTLTVAGLTYMINQAAGTGGGVCNYSVSATALTVGGAGGAVPLVVTASAADCAWTATSNVAWITIPSGASGIGNGTVNLNLQANAAAISRLGTVTIAGKTVTITQQAAGSCVVTLAPLTRTVPLTASSQSLTVTSSFCFWTASSTVNWITLISSTYGFGNGTIIYSVAPNIGGTRTGTIIVNGNTHVITQ